MYYAKSNPIETIEEHTNKLLENMKLLKELYGVQILNEAKFDKERFWILLEIICTYHDLGKVYTPFQNIIRKQLNEPLLTTEFNYEFVKHEQLSPMFVPIQKYNLTKDEKKLVYQSIYYHHEREGKDINNIYVQEIIEKDIMLQLEKIKNEVPYELPGNINCMYIKYIQNRNRIKQNDELFIEYCLLKGILHRLDHSSSAEMYVEDSTLENIANYVQDFMKKRKYIKNDLQEYCTENSNDNLLVIGSTGMGKTESALFWSNGEKTFFTLPIRTSINAIYDRINESIGYQHIGLLHSTALDYLEEKDEFGNQEEIYRQSQNLSQKITACTIDQIFPFVFKYKGYEKMYATLSYSKLIIDEIQAYSPEIVAIIIKGLEMIYKNLQNKKIELALFSSSQYNIMCDEDETFKSNIKIVSTLTKKLGTKPAEEVKDETSDHTVKSGTFNIYISGIDTTGSIRNVSRSDANMLLTVNTKTHQILLTSIPRDYYVTLHTYKAKDKLTHSGIYGIKETVSTVEDFMGIDINYYVRVNFTTVIKMVDVIGGIDVYSDYEFVASSGDSFKKGMNHLNGEKALAFSRERYSFADGDR